MNNNENVPTKKEKLQEILSKPISEVFSKNDMIIILENLTDESMILLNIIDDLSSKVYKILENLNQRFTKNPVEFEYYYDIVKHCFFNLTNKTKNLFDYSISWIFSLFNKTEVVDHETAEKTFSKEDFSLKLIFEVINNNDFLKIDPNIIMKNYNLEDNLYFKILKKKKENLESINCIYYIQEVILC